MPQLNPAPWFLIFMLIWTTTICLMTKILNIYPRPQIPQYIKKTYNYHWTWPWL
uniref:ATP synthase complex subunit 8 n=1 Tax=Zootoca vivipara TaxID=8524 RepID=A0A6B9TP30_ZOOVI|nr:ATP synthase F0 subunit 8 [Zootoca vivipara]